MKLFAALGFAIGVNGLSEYSGFSGYAVSFDHASIPISAVADILQQQDVNGTYELLKSNDKDYLCYIPNLQPEETPDQGRLDIVEERLIVENAAKLISASFSKNECSFRIDSPNYWTYGFCFGDKIVQFHSSLEALEQNKLVPKDPDHVFILAHFSQPSEQTLKDERAGKGVLSNNAPKRFRNLHPSSFQLQYELGRWSNQFSNLKYVLQNLRFGEICGVTKMPRTAEVAYTCANSQGNSEIIWVQENNLCHYKIVINVPKLCTLEQFQTVNQNQIGPIPCKAIGDDEEGSEKSYFHLYSKQLPELALFPIQSDYRINLVDFALVPCGYAFFLGQIKEPVENNTYLTERTILIYNGELKETLTDLLSRMMATNVARTFVAPTPHNDSLLDWSDQFVLWFEVYDLTGKFLSLARLERNEACGPEELHINLINPDTMMDSEQQFFEPPVWKDGAWNFESFHREVKQIPPGSVIFNQFEPQQ